MKKVAIVQSNYIPWKGYFDMIAAVDEFILFDDAQYTPRDWRNRNKIKTPRGTQWLTVPVRVRGKYHQSIRETELSGSDWAVAHWKALCLNYRRAAHFDAVAKQLEPLYLRTQYSHLARLNRSLIEWVCDQLAIKTKISDSSEYVLNHGKTERLANLCAQVGAAEYISGPAAKGYIDESVFARNGIKVTWFDYLGYPQYPQLWGAFRHDVTILDLLFNCAKDAPRYMRYVCP
jgi:WbqC-like protein family